MSYNWKQDKQLIIEIIKKFIISSLFAGLIQMVMLFPVIGELQHNFREVIFYNRTGIDGVFNTMSQLGFHQQSVKVLYAVPYLFCGYITFFLLVNWWIHCKVKKEKYAFTVVMMLFIGSLLLKSFILIWHGGSTPILFCFRHTFLIDFFAISIVAKNFVAIKSFSKRTMLGIAVVSIIIIVMGALAGDVVENPVIIGLNLLFMIMTILLLEITIHYSSIRYKLALLILCILQFVILLKTNFITNKNIKNQENLRPYMAEIARLQKSLESLPTHERMSGKNVYKQNELLGSNIGRIEHFLSSIDGSFIRFLEASGYPVSSSDIKDNPDAKYMNALLGIHYYYNIDCDDALGQERFIKLANNDITVCWDDMALNLAYMIKDNEVVVDKQNYFTYQNSFFEKITGEKIYQAITLKPIGRNHYLIENKDGGDIYIGFQNEVEFPRKIIANGKVIAKKRMGYIKVPAKNVDKVDLYIDSYEDIKNIVAYQVDEEQVERLFLNLKKQQATVKTMHKNKMVLHINNSSNNRTLLITVPYDINFEIKVDGKRVSYRKIFDTFIGCDLQPGIHEIELLYKNRGGLYLGIIISCLSMMGAVRYLTIK
ncbi:MAG: YfhO family protein [Bacilli bacterium]|nr:YfhO family protein [Bacilli bacterium]